MQHLSNIFYIPAALLALLLLSCSGGQNVIPQKTMVTIVGEMYLADQYIEERPHLRAQTDTLILYEAVTMRHGYTFADYKSSVQYYLTKGDALKNIHVKARKQLLKRRDDLNRLMSIEKAANMRIRWWGEDTLRTKHINSLWKEPYLRNLKWLGGYDVIQEWRFTDTTTSDIPQNGLWWKNNLLLVSAESPADSLYPILQRDWLIWKENSQDSEGSPMESVKKRTPKPDMKRFNKSKEMETKSINKAKKRIEEKKRLNKEN